MIDLGPYADYILWAWGSVAALVLLLILWVAVEARRVTRKLSDLEARGIRRRSNTGTAA